MENPETELLILTVSPAGAAGIKRLIGITRWNFILGIFATVLSFVDALFRNVYLHADKYIAMMPVYLEMKVHNWYLLIVDTVFLCQMYCYVIFARKANKGVQELDSGQFNGSFDWLYRSGVLAFIGLVLAIFLWMLNIWMNYYLAELATHRRS